MRQIRNGVRQRKCLLSENNAYFSLSMTTPVSSHGNSCNVKAAHTGPRLPIRGPRLQSSPPSATPSHTHTPGILRGCQRSLRRALCCRRSSGDPGLTGCCSEWGGAPASYWNWPSGRPGGDSGSWQGGPGTHPCWGTPRGQTVLEQTTQMLHPAVLSATAALSSCGSHRWSVWWWFKADSIPHYLTPTRMCLWDSGCILEGM